MRSGKLLVDLNKQIEKCRRCPLYKTATHAVPGEGDPNAKIMFVGEAPGRVEDETGRPFVGRAGKLLDQLLASIGIERKSVFITSVVKHRPPKNRQPKPSEVKACIHWLNLQLNIINPRLIVTLGRFGLEYFLPHEKISLIHGTIKSTIISGKSFMIFPVYHPAAALRSTRNRQTLEKDFKKLKSIYGTLF
ncbi:uracil-DNA glycosylase [Candidatus Gottesmanbacteria bacterium]|nr:uracil-DNA glycosylase [Candidatus Gottesmanbacteria bacterium]